MADATGRARLTLALVGLCWLLGVAAVAAGTLRDDAYRQVSALSGRYFDALTRKDTAAALATLAPEVRAGWADWVANQTGNRFRIEGLAVREPSLLERLGAPASPREASLTVRVTLESGEAVPRPAVTVVRLAQRDGRLVFLEPPLFPPRAAGA